MRRRLPIQLLTLLLFLIGAFADGYSQVITSQQNGSWFSPSTWNCTPAPCIPSSTSEVIVNHSVTLDLFDWIIDAPGSVTVAAGGSLLQSGSRIMYMTGGSFTNNGSTNISYFIMNGTGTTLTNNDSLRTESALYNLGTVINNGIIADVDSLANYGTFINNPGARVRAKLFYTADSCVNSGYILAKYFTNEGEFVNNRFLGTINLFNTGNFFNNPGSISNAALFRNLGYFENNGFSELNITYDFYNGDTLQSSAFFGNDGFVGVGRNWYNFLGDTVDGSFGQFCVSELTYNKGDMVGSFEICDNTPTFSPIDINVGNIELSISSCGSPCKMVLSFSVDSLTCSGNCDGKIVARVYGGSSPYTFLWDNGSTADSIIGICEGVHRITVTDAAGDTLRAGVLLLTPLPIELILSNTEALCGDSTGTATVLATQGNEPYTYLWNDPLNQTTATAVGLPPGLYSVDVTDSSSCIAVGPIFVGQPPGLSISLNVTNSTCPDSANGSIEVTVNGGLAPFTYLWEPGTGSGIMYDSILPGSYTVTVTDSNGCTITGAEKVNSVGGEDCFEWHIFSGITPNGDGVDDHWIIRGLYRFDQVSVVIFSNRGIVVWESDNYQNDWGGTDLEGRPLMEGIYYYIVSRPEKRNKGWIYLTR